MSAFRAVNTPLPVPSATPKEEEVKTPTTPRPNLFFGAHSSTDSRAEDASAKTPTKASFGGLTEQKPPTEPTVTFGTEPTTSEERVGTGIKRESLHRPSKSVDAIDTTMLDEEDAAVEGSDNESTTDDGNRPSKKKKGQRFFCTEFPPCQLSFTRSEHLARHIRKHTGERPFQCHCNRRFSRLDNLRQHAQTVHVNEDIPGDSLAATGTRFQRQIRTDRVRPPSSRSRASTHGSQGSHSRGHSRNLSASSIASTTSTLSQREDGRRRPPPLAMANDAAARARLSLDTYPNHTGSAGNQYHGFGSNSASGFSTPTSASVSTGTGSPMFTPAHPSPASRPRPVTWGGGRTPGRRLSVPSGAPLFQAALGPTPYPNAYGSQVQSSASSVYSGNGSVLASPASSVFSETRRDSTAEADWRRRTWHPGTYQTLTQRPATSGLSYHQTPDAPAPAQTSQPAANQTRLPGIESFDRFSNGNPPPPALIRRQPSPMQVDSPAQPAGPQPMEPSSTMTREERQQKHISWDFALRKGFNELDIANATPPREPPQWPQHPQPIPRPTTAPHPGFGGQPVPTQHAQPVMPPQSSDPRTAGPESPDVSNNCHAPGWYNAPLPMFQPQPPPLSSQPNFPPRPTSHGHLVQRTSPEDSSSSEGVPTPGASSIGEYHPAIVHSNGYVEPHRPALSIDESSQQKASPLQGGSAPAPPPQYGQPVDSRPPVSLSFQPGPTIIESHPPPPPAPQGQPNDTRRLEALVAVATGENMGVAARP